MLLVCTHPRSNLPALLSLCFLCLFWPVTFLAFSLARCLIGLQPLHIWKRSTITAAAILPPSSWNWKHSFLTAVTALPLSKLPPSSASVPRRTQAVENVSPRGGSGELAFSVGWWRPRYFCIQLHSLPQNLDGMFPFFLHVPYSWYRWQSLPGLEWEFGIPSNNRYFANVQRLFSEGGEKLVFY